MEQPHPPGASRGGNEERANGRDDPGRSAALRAMPSRRDVPLSPESVAAHEKSVNTYCHPEGRQTEGDVEGSHPERALLGPAEVAEFALIAVNEGPDAAMARIDVLRAAGLTLDTIYLDLMAPAARHLGELWVDDRCDFTEVTIGLGALHQVLRELSPAFRSGVEWQGGQAAPSVNPGRRLLLVPAAGEQHSLGLMMIADFFGRAGWDVTAGETPSGPDLFRMVRDQWFDVVGLAVGCDRRLELLAADIRTLRATSCNRDLRVMVGGPILVQHPEYADAVGADAMAVDARAALDVAASLLAAPRPGPGA